MARCRPSVPVLAFALLCAGCSAPREPRVHEVTIVGRTELIRVDEAGLDFLARLDEPGHTTSIHAADVRVVDGAPAMRDNIGRIVRFRLVNERGDERRLAARVEGVTEGSGAAGDVPHYRVPLRLRLGVIDRVVPVTLLDLGAQPYRLIVGRDWIGDDLVVDARREAAGRELVR